MHKNLNSWAWFDFVDYFQAIFFSSFDFLSPFVDKKSKHQTHSIGKNPDKCISLIVNSELFGLVEDFVRLEDNIFTFKNGKCKYDRNDHRKGEKTVSKPFLCSVDDEEWSSKNGEQNIHLEDPEPLEANFAVKDQTSEHKPHLVHNWGAVSSIFALPKLIQRFINKWQAEVSSHAGENQNSPLDQKLVKEIPSNFVETAEFEQGVGEFDSQNKNDDAVGNFDVAEENSSERVEPVEWFGLVGSDSLSVAELCWENNAESGQEHYWTHNVFLIRPLE